MVTKESDDTGVDSKDTKSTNKARRGKVILIPLAKRKAKGIKNLVEFNHRGQPCGSVATEMQSYIGVLARQEVKVCYESWNMVPTEVKDVIWEHVTIGYEVDKNWKAGCLESAGVKWRQWKSNLYKKHIAPYKGDPAKLKDPPPGSGILREDWSQFVMSRITEKFEKWSEEQTQRVKKNIYPHRLSRRGYAGLAEKMKHELCGDDEVDRCIMWKKARVPKNGDIEDENLKNTVQRIDDFIRKKEEGEFKAQSPNEDLLTCALESREHAGRVRAIGSYVTPTMFFKRPKERRQHLNKGKEDELVEARKQIVEQNQKINLLEDRLGKLEAAMKRQTDDEDKGSCSVKQPCHLMDEDLEEEKENEEDEDEVLFVDKVDILQDLTIVSAKNKRVESRVVKERMVKCYDSLLPSLKGLYLHAEKSMSTGQETLLIPFDNDTFGKPFEVFVVCEDIILFCDLEPITGNCIVLYICHLYKRLKDNSALHRCQFVNPFEVSYVPNGPHDARIHALANRLENVSSDQLVIVPCNIREHWILTVVDPHKEIIYNLDPISHRYIDDSWKTIVNTAIFIFNAKLGKRGKKQPTWDIIKSPRQPNSVQCGFFVMRYMQEIIEELMRNGCICLHPHFDNRSYTKEDIDEVRVEWANLVLSYI